MELSLVLKMLHLKPRVVHRLPGRVRVHIPALRQVTLAFQTIVDVLVTKFSLPTGIENVKINYITGNLLILYDHKCIQEKDVLSWLSDLSLITGKIWIRFKNSANGNGKLITENLLQFFSESSKSGNVLDKNFIIPDYVWN
jgi:hypothetical protein